MCTLEKRPLKPDIKPIASALILVIVLGFCFRANALTLVSRKKTVSIAPDWTVSGRYESIFRIETPSGTEKFSNLVEQVRQAGTLPESLTIGIEPPEQNNHRQKRPDTEALDSLPLGTHLTLSFETRVRFPGFEALFADFFTIEQAGLPAEAFYSMDFPGEIDFRVSIIQGQSRQNRSQRANRFQWSSPGVNHLEIMVTTALEWLPVIHRYQALYRERYKGGIQRHQIPGLEAGGDSDEHLSEVLAFLKRTVHYRLRPETDYDLIPDPPLTVLNRGWGDCKDLALLGAAILECLGTDADVILVGQRPEVRSRHNLPDPFGYTHALLTVNRSDSHTDYIDVTTGNPIPLPESDVPPARLRFP